jgi:hypothetical protein
MMFSLKLFLLFFSFCVFIFSSFVLSQNQINEDELLDKMVKEAMGSPTQAPVKKYFDLPRANKNNQKKIDQEDETIPTTTTSTVAEVERADEQLFTTTTATLSPTTKKNKKKVVTEQEQEIQEQQQQSQEEIPMIKTQSDLIEAVVLQRIRETKFASLKASVMKTRSFEKIKCSSKNDQQQGSSTAEGGAGSNVEDEEDPVCAIKRVS